MNPNRRHATRCNEFIPICLYFMLGLPAQADIIYVRRESSRKSMRCAIFQICTTVALLALFAFSAQAQPALPPEITIVSQQRDVNLLLVADGFPNISGSSDQSSATNNGPFGAQFFNSVSGNLGTSASGSASHNSVISTFKIEGEGSADGTATGGTDEAGASAEANSFVFIRFTVPVDATFSFSGSIEASFDGVIGLGMATASVSGIAPGGAPFNISESANGQISSDPVPFFHAQEVMGGTEVILSVSAGTTVIDTGLGTGSGAAEFDFSLDFGDKDGDGLLDIWETDGIDIDGDGTLEIDLPGMGANPMKKDIFVELDAMSGVPVDMVAINDVKDSFANAPASLINNPDGSAGITLHVIVDETILFAQTLIGAEWPPAFDLIKADHYGSTSDRARTDWPDLKKARERIFRYCLWADMLILDPVEPPPIATPPIPYTGVGERPGDDFIVAAGYTASTFSNRPSEALAGTFMHELGHTLGLRHGGVDSVNFKPNYLSVMNYTYQAPFTGSEPAWFLDYSRTVLPPLDESLLDDSSALGGPIFKNVMFNSAPDGQPPIHVIIPADAGAVDWNQNSIVEPAAVQDINRIVGLTATPGETHRGSIDWNHLWYSLSGSVNFEDGISRDLSSIEIELNDSQIMEMHATPVIDLTNTCPADTDDNGMVNVTDLLGLLAVWGSCGPSCSADINTDGFVNVTDLLALLGAWGACP